MSHAAGIARLDGITRRVSMRSVWNESEFREFYAHTASRLKAYLARLTSSRDLANDLLQEAYLRFLRSAPPLADLAARKAYLYRIATNLARDHFRSSAAEKRALQERETEPLITAVRAETASDVQRLLGELRARERELLLLAYMEGASHREIAAVTGYSERSIRPLLCRARRKFAVLLRTCGLVVDAPQRRKP
jgi:RNA polymerase sigma-70 factor (ECF subfamily)